jgi:hypothetical protein
MTERQFPLSPPDRRDHSIQTPAHAALGARSCRWAGECSPLPRQHRCFISGITVSDSPVAVRGVGERGPLGPPEDKERS